VSLRLTDKPKSFSKRFFYFVPNYRGNGGGGRGEGWGSSLGPGWESRVRGGLWEGGGVEEVEGGGGGGWAGARGGGPLTDKEHHIDLTETIQDFREKHQSDTKCAEGRV